MLITLRRLSVLNDQLHGMPVADHVQSLLKCYLSQIWKLAMCFIS